MTQPPQWGGPPPRPQYQAQHLVAPYPQPPQLTILTLLNWLFAVALFGFAAIAVVSATMSDDVHDGIGTALFLIGIGMLNVLAVFSLNEPHFPNTVQSRWASGYTAFAFLSVLLRSVNRGTAEIGPVLVVAAIMVACLFSLFLTTRPQVKQWIAAKHHLSLSQGHQPPR